jgi:hypothetical protein
MKEIICCPLKALRIPQRPEDQIINDAHHTHINGNGGKCCRTGKKTTPCGTGEQEQGTEAKGHQDIAENSKKTEIPQNGFRNGGFAIKQDQIKLKNDGEPPQQRGNR